MNDIDADSQVVQDEEFFDANLLTVSRQWNLLYKEQFRQFLESYGKPTSDRESNGTNDNPPISNDVLHWSHYQQAALDATRFGMKSIIINLQHIYDWNQGTNLATFIQRFFLPLWKFIDNAVDRFVKQTLQKYFQTQPDNGGINGWSNLSNIREEDTQHAGFLQDMSVYEKMNFYAFFTSVAPSSTVRELRCDVLGELINIRGTATRLSDVRPELRCATFECGQCHSTIETVEQQFKFTEPQLCLNSECKNRTTWILRPESCQFADWQKMRLQENSAEIPAGSMPRVIDVILTRGLCDQCKPGDKVLISGCLAAVPDVPSLMKPGELPRSVAIDRNRLLSRTDQGMFDNAVMGLRKLGVRDLGYRLLLFALDIKTLNSGLNAKDERNHEESSECWLSAQNQPSDSIELVMGSLGLSLESQRLFLEIAGSHDTLDKLAASIAPEIFGCESVKKGILTMLVGGVEKNTGKDQLKLRGDINICIVGDPGTAKSQLLKFVHQFSSRAVYAAGNTSTAAGLTVSIHKDPDQGDAVIEAGALMLADKGICCIDEFDKMDLKDMVAIHEAMEQQTISICKAGIQATLNARASILAACNPRNGQFDTSKSFRHNVRLSAPIISRFDLFFTMLDGIERDGMVAKHLLALHTSPTTAMLDNQGLLTALLLKQYIAVARSRRPRITAESRHILVESYVAMRAEGTQIGNRTMSHITVRQLESLIRLSEAIAKLKFSDIVHPIHVKEARQLIHFSLIKLDKGTVSLNDDEDDIDGSSNTISSNNGTHTTLTDQQNQQTDNKSSTISIDAEEYEKIATYFIDRIRALEIEMTQVVNNEEFPVEAVIARDDLITWYIDQCSDPVISDSEHSLEQEFYKLNKVLNRMIHRDFTLIEEERNMHVPIGDTDETEIQRMVAVRLHPNLANDQPGYIIRDGHHASLPTAFYGDSTTESNHMIEDEHTLATGVVDDSWSVNDQDFMNYMYGWTEDT